MTRVTALRSAQNDGRLIEGFADAVIDWFEIHGRHNLPWQAEPSPYRVWVSEIMLQQTRVGTVIPYFQRFMARFPDVAALAAADIDQVLHLWTGLGYYARARNLHKAARTIIEEHGGRFPDTLAELERLSGIGRSTAGAILALAHGRCAPILDGNVKRVLARCFAVEGYPGNGETLSELWALAERLLPGGTDGPAVRPSSRSGAQAPAPTGRRPNCRTGSGRSRIAAYTQGMMDLGATLCARANPRCLLCPLRQRCLARQRGEIDRYPGKKPAKTLPVRSATMFILQDPEGRVLLEKRPPSGIWGSLYSLPQIDTTDGTPITTTTDGTPITTDTTTDGTPIRTEKEGTPINANDGTPLRAAENPAAIHAASAASAQMPSLPAGLRFANEPPVELPPVRHGFTHFRLEITPIRYKLAQTASTAADSGRWLWYSIVDPVEVGIAAPVGKLLAALAPAEPQRTATSTKREEP